MVTNATAWWGLLQDQFNKVVAINVSSLGKGNQMTRKRASAWALDDRWQPVEIKPAHKAKCPQGMY